MEPAQYDVMARREERHWWYAGMRRVALALLASALPPRSLSAPPRRILDAGCGSGGTTRHLRRFGDVVGVDLSPHALRYAATRGLPGRLARASVESLPFRDGAFDVVTSFEVVYHLGVGDDRRALAEMRRVLGPGGLLLLRLPAHDWLRGEHDRLVHTRHRYTPAEVDQKLRTVGFDLLQVSWANSLLFLPAAAKRLLLERRSASATNTHGEPEPDLWQPPAPLNSLLEAAVSVEALALPRGIPLPFGLSVIALAKAPAPAPSGTE